VEKRVDRTRN